VGHAIVYTNIECPVPAYTYGTEETQARTSSKGVDKPP
jgi:hypothetical protein